MSKIVLASSNPGKLREFQEIFQSTGIQLVPQSEFGVLDADETGLSFVENAIIKARNASAITGMASLSDDSGIEVDALKGAPGIYSARYGGATGTHADSANNEKLLEALKDVSDDQRTARFQCVIVYMQHAQDPTPLICQGTWEGRILHSANGVNGFGYDPLFYVPTHDCASAQLDKAVKNSLSHRGQALRQLIRCWHNRP
ncbi:MAG: XTP/dITP diphosphohydrolase [Pseudohongiellaceae bacterium]